jgi:Fe-S oxidoreductase
LHDYGFLDLAKRLLRQVMDALEPEIEAGVPLVGLEPSCVAIFRDELVNFFPDDQRARRLSAQSYLLSEFLMRHARRFRPPKLARQALVHGHCHHKAVMGTECDKDALRRLGLDYTLLEAGCCGMAGAFGFERGHYEISMQVGERVLLPAVRAAAKDTLIVADGFSCREQIAQSTDRHALHLAQVIQMALRESPVGPSGDYPEQTYIRMKEPVAGASLGGLVAVAGTGAALLGAALWARRRHR